MPRQERKIYPSRKYGDGSVNVKALETIKLPSGELVLIDARDYDRIKKYFWYRWAPKKGGQKYAVAHVTPKSRFRTLMHRFIMDAKSGEYVAHINENRMDNRRANLRICTSPQSKWGRNKPKGKSEYLGVSSTKRRPGRWHVRISCNGVRHHVGYFKSEIEAAKAYDRKARELEGGVAKTNFPLDMYSKEFLDG